MKRFAILLLALSGVASAQTVINGDTVQAGVTAPAGIQSDYYRANVTQTTDSVTTPVSILGQHAWSQATGANRTGGTLYLGGGVGSTFYTVVTYGSTSGKTVTITGNGAATTLTEGSDWQCVTAGSNNTCASNLATAINANSTIKVYVTATAVGAVVYLDPRKFLYTKLTIATNAGAPLTATMNTSGGVAISAIDTTINNLRFTTSTLAQGGWHPYNGTGDDWAFGQSNTDQRIFIGAGGVFGLAGTNGWIRWSNSNADAGTTADTGLSKVAAGRVGVGTGGPGSAVGSIARIDQILAKTGAYTTTAADSPSTFTNTGAGGSVTITLLNDPTAGTFYCFAGDAAQDLVVAPNTGETLNDGATGYSSVKVNGPGNTFCVKAITGGSGAKWIVTDKNGTVTDTP